MSSPEQDQEDVGATASGSELDEEDNQSPATPESGAASVSPRSSVELEEAEASMSSRQSNDSMMMVSPEPMSRNDLIKNLLVKVENDFAELCMDEIKLRKATESFLDRMIDFVTLGVAFSVYREIKMGAYTAAVVRMEQLAEDKPKVRSDIFAEYYDKERKCVCSKCTKMVLASGFAIHLEVCMGIKQSRTRNARRVVTATSTREQDSPTYESMPSSEEDDDDDADWSCGGEKRKKKRDRNGTKRVKGTPTKKTEIDSSELMEVEDVDIEGEPGEIVYEEEEPDDDIFSLSEFFVDDSSQSYATASSGGTRSNTSSDEAVTKMDQSSPSPTSSL